MEFPAVGHAMNRGSVRVMPQRKSRLFRDILDSVVLMGKAEAVCWCGGNA
jgi:hypothetical protein